MKDPLQQNNPSLIEPNRVVQAGEVFLKNNRKWVVLCIIAFSVVFRLIYFIQINAGPLVHLHDCDQTDMHFFHTWAVAITQGDVLTEKLAHPYAHWHKEIADNYFSTHPEAVLALANDRSSPEGLYDPVRLLWNRWFGGKQFHQEPLYPYFIAGVYKVFGADVRWIFLFQILAGICVNLLIYLIARSYFSDRVAVTSAFLAVFYGPLLYYDMILVRSTFVVFLQLALILLFDIVLKRKSLLPWILLGAASGFAILLKTTFLFFVFGFASLVIFRYRNRAGEAARYTGMLLLGVFISLSPAIARNLIVGAPPLSLSSVGPIVFVLMNDNTPAEMGPIVNVGAAARIMGDTGGELGPVLIETLKSYGSVTGFLAHQGTTLSKLFNWYEAPNNTNYYLYRSYAPVLRFTFITFLVLSPLSLAGLALAFFRRPECRRLYLFMGLQIALILGFGVSSRYRMPLVVLLFPFAAFSLVELVDGLMSTKKRGMFLAAVVLLLSLWTSHTRFNGVTPIRDGDFIIVYVTHYQNLVNSLADANDFYGAAEVMREFLEYEPSGLLSMNGSHPVKTLNDSGLAKFFSSLHRTYALLLHKAGNDVLSKSHEFRANDLADAASPPGVVLL